LFASAKVLPACWKGEEERAMSEGERKERNRSLQPGHSLTLVRFVLPLCRMLKVFTFFIATRRRSCMCVKAKKGCYLGQKPLHIWAWTWAWAWPNRFLLIFGDFCLKGAQKDLNTCCLLFCCCMLKLHKPHIIKCFAAFPKRNAI